MVVANVEEVYAYAVGYYDGRSNGEDKNYYAPEHSERHWYTLGYETGVSDYCRELEEA